MNFKKLFLVFFMFEGVFGYSQVGIGTNTPGQKLDIQDGNLRLMNTSLSTDIEFKNTTTNWHAATISQLKDGSTFGSHLAFKLHSSDSALSALPSEAFRIKSNGFVGIGNNNPQINLSVGSTNLGHRIGRAIIDGLSQNHSNKRDTIALGRWDGPTFSDDIFLGLKFSVASGASVGESSDNQSFMTFHTWGSNIVVSREVMRLDQRGRLGIGIVPSYTLDAFSTNDVVSRLRSNNIYGASFILNPTASGGVNSQIYSTANSNSLGAGKLIFMHNNIYALTINSSGFLGIGNTSPTNKLHIVENTANAEIVKIESNVTSQGFGSMQGVTLQNNGSLGTYSGFLFKNSSGTTACGFGYQSTDNTNHYGDLVFGGKGSTGWSEKMRIMSNGNIGVGTSSPTEKLDVNGAVKIGNPYSGITNGATTPVPAGGAGTVVFSGSSFFGWNGSTWKQLDN